MRIRMHLSIGLLAASMSTSVTLSADDRARTTDVQSGQEAYGKCMACHSPERNRTGPLHCGVVGRVAGTVQGYNYSKAMRSAGITWSVEALNRFLEAPLDMIPGTSMGVAGLADENERRQLIAWLAALTPSSAYCDGAPSVTTGDTHE